MESGREKESPFPLPPSPETPLISPAEVRAVVEADRAEWETETAQPARRIGFQSGPFSTVKESAQAPVSASVLAPPVASPNPPVAVAEIPPVKPPVIPPGVPPGPNPPVAGVLSDLPLISWEIDRDGGYECWFAPKGVKAARSSKTYLGRVGKRELKRLASLPESDRIADLSRKVEEWKAKKGIRA